MNGQISYGKCDICGQEIVNMIPDIIYTRKVIEDKNHEKKILCTFCGIALANVKDEIAKSKCVQEHLNAMAYEYILMHTH